MTLRDETSAVGPGSVAVIPAGVPHSLEAAPSEQLELVIFGTPPMSLEDERASPRKVSPGELDH
ncbi:MAG: AraC family ligand binding domain-containing protein [Pirellulaceae bacterium]